MRVIFDTNPINKNKYEGKYFNENIDDSDVASAFARLSLSLWNDKANNNIISVMSDVQSNDIDDDMYIQCILYTLCNP